MLTLAVGPGYEGATTEWEHADGKIEQVTLPFAIATLTGETLARQSQVDKRMLTAATFWTWLRSSDRRYKRNVVRLRAVFQFVIDEGRKNLKPNSDDAFDLLTGLLKSETYG